MIYTVTFYNIAEDREDFSVFQDLGHAHAFIETRPEGYGEAFEITEESEDGEHKIVVK